MKNTIKTFSVCLLPLLFSASQGFAETNGDLTFNHQLKSVVEIDSSSTISVYNTGLSMNMQDTNGLSADFRSAIDGKIDTINSKNFELGRFIKQLDMNYAVDMKDAIILLSVGKMPTGAKTDMNNPSQVGGVMGIRLSIEPEKVPLIQEWLTANHLQINRIDITRYDAESGNRLDLKDLNNTNMTSYAVYLSQNNNIQTFFIYKTPDSNNVNGVTSETVGAVYVMGGKLKPELFAMKHQSKASFMDLDLLVLSAGVEVRKNIRSTFTYSNATELVSSTNVKSYDVSVSEVFKESKDFSFTATFGAKVEQGSTDNKVVYFRLEAKY